MELQYTDYWTVISLEVKGFTIKSNRLMITFFKL